MTCRSCGGADLPTVLDLGRTPLANSLLLIEDLRSSEATYPLEVVFCSACSLMQIKDALLPADLFREYLYFSSFSETMLQHARQLSERIVSERGLKTGDHVLEIASNDGYLLQFYQDAGVTVTGVEPAENVARVAVATHGIPTVREFFNIELAKRLRVLRGPVDVIHAHNVLAHVPELNEFVAGIHWLLKPDGVAVIEVPYVRDLIDKNEFDTIYHEHVFYFSLTALLPLFDRHALQIHDVERVAIHGGSLRLFVTHAAAGPARPSVAALLDAEKVSGLDRFDYYKHFASRVTGVKTALRALLLDLKAEGKRLAAYGASAKGSTLLNYCEIDVETLDFVVDRNPHKQGRLMPGARLPIVSPDALLTEQPDYVLLLTWNFADEILAQQARFRDVGGRFITPIPIPRVL